MNAVALLSKVFRKPYRTVGPQEAAALIDADGLLLDVREAPEWRAGHALNL
jgi:rhodanese-related sulfurtransferase